MGFSFLHNERVMKRENEALKFHYALLEEDFSELEARMAQLQVNDDEIYRSVFRANPISDDLRQVGVGGSERYLDLMDLNEDMKGVVAGLRSRVEKMKNQARLQAESYEELWDLVRRKDLESASIPAIQPIANREIYRLSSGFGKRIDPIYKVKKMHWGIDFSARKGTPVYATGAGHVRLVNNRHGYGKYVIIDHGFNYRTLYAHLSSFSVETGAVVKRGDVIGFVGSTGKSTSSHLHYEIHYGGVKVNPIYYFSHDLSEEDYYLLSKRSSIENQSLD